MKELCNINSFNSPEQGEEYSDRQERYFMVPNWLFGEGEYIDLDNYKIMVLMYIIRLVNKKDNRQGKGDIFFLASEKLGNICGFSNSKAKKVLKKLQVHGYIKKIKTGSNLTGKANTYKVMNLQLIYVKGEEVALSEAEQNLSEEEFDELLYKCKGVV